MSAQDDFDLDTNTSGAAKAMDEADAAAKAPPKRKPVKKPVAKAAAEKPASKPAPKKKAPAKKPAPAKTSAPKEPAKEPDTKPVAKKDGDPSSDVIGGNAKKQLQSFRERIENLEAEKAEVAAEIKEVYAEAKSHGFDTTILRKVIAAAKKDQDKRAEQAALFDLYAGALGVEVYSAMEA
jgi:uncharacterized protein (UPF0335 family)